MTKLGTSVSKGMNVSTIVSILIPLSQIMAVYRSPIPAVDMGSFLLIFAFALGVISFQGKIKILESDLPWYVYILYIFILTFISIVVQGYSPFDIHLTVRMYKHILFILLLLCFKNFNMIDKQVLFSSYKCLAKICTLYIFLQFFLYLFGIGLPGIINSLIYVDAYSDMTGLAQVSFFRPTSLFYEPSHYAAFVYPAIILYLFDGSPNHIKDDYFNAIFVTAGVFVSTSSYGILIAVLTWGIKIAASLYNQRGRLNSILIGIVFFGFVFVQAFFYTGTGQKILQRTLSIGAGSTFTGRMESYTLIPKLAGIKLLFGIGYDRMAEIDSAGLYYSSWAFNVICLGIIGTLFIYIIFRRYLKSSFMFVKILSLAILVDCLGYNSFAGTRLLFLFSFLICYRNYEVHRYYSNELMLTESNTYL